MPPAKIAVSPPSMRILRASNSQEPGSRQLGLRWDAARVTGMAGCQRCAQRASHGAAGALHRGRQRRHQEQAKRTSSGGPTEGRPRPSRGVYRAPVARGRLQGLAIRSSLVSATTNVPGQEHQGASLASPGPASKPLSPGCRLLHRTAALHLHCTAALWLDAQCHTLLSAVLSPRFVACHCLPSPPAF
jgi:hypothetical protein